MKHKNCFRGFQMSAIPRVFGLQRCVTNLDMFFLAMGFISLFNEIQFMLISSRHFRVNLYGSLTFFLRTFRTALPALLDRVLAIKFWTLDQCTADFTIITFALRRARSWWPALPVRMLITVVVTFWCAQKMKKIKKIKTDCYWFRLLFCLYIVYLGSLVLLVDLFVSLLIVSHPALWNE